MKNERLIKMTELDTATFQETIKSGVSVVDFWAGWCVPCQIFAPVLEELAGEMESVAFCKVNIEENDELARQFSITNIPTVIVFKDGEPVSRMVGVKQKDEVQAAIQSHL